MKTAKAHWISLLGIWVLGTIVCIAYTQRVVEGWDPVAYLYAGQRLAQGTMPSFCSHFNAQIGPYFTLAGFNVRLKNNHECLFLNYPPGFPMLLAMAQKLSGTPEAALYVPAVFGGLGLFFTFTTGKLLFDNPGAGLVGALLLLCAPTFLQFSTSPWSDGPGAALLMGGVTAAMIGERSRVPGVQVIMGSIGALAIGWGIFIRYMNGLAIIPLMVYWGLKYRLNLLSKWFVLSFAICLACIVAGVLVFNRIYFGGYFSTGYSPAHGWYDWPPFSLRYALQDSPAGGRSLVGVFHTLITNYSWLLFLAGVGLTRMSLPQLALVVGNLFLFIALYSFYAFAPTGINARFLLPAFPWIGISIGHALTGDAFPGWRKKWRSISLVLVVMTMLLPLPGRLQELRLRNARAASYVERMIRLVEDTESSAVFLAYDANDAIAYYGQRTTLFYRRIPWKDGADFESSLIGICKALLERQVPIYFVLDRDPPLWNSLAVLRRHCVLLPLNTDPPSYRIQYCD